MKKYTRYFAITYTKDGYYIGKSKYFNTYWECLKTELSQFFHTKYNFKIFKEFNLDFE